MESKRSGQERVSLFFATQQNFTKTKHKQGKTIAKNQEIGLDQQQACLLLLTEVCLKFPEKMPCKQYRDWCINLTKVDHTCWQIRGHEVNKTNHILLWQHNQASLFDLLSSLLSAVIIHYLCADVLLQHRTSHTEVKWILADLSIEGSLRRSHTAR